MEFWQQSRQSRYWTFNDSQHIYLIVVFIMPLVKYVLFLQGLKWLEKSWQLERVWQLLRRCEQVCDWSHIIYIYVSILYIIYICHSGDHDPGESPILLGEIAIVVSPRRNYDRYKKQIPIAICTSRIGDSPSTDCNRDLS